MGITTRIAMVIILFLCFSVKVGEGKISWTVDEPLIKQAVARAPFFKYKADLYLGRLADEDDPSLIMREFNDQLRHFQVDADSNAISCLSSSSFSLHKQAAIGAEGVAIKVDNTDSACWNVSAAFSDVSQRYLLVWQDERNSIDNPDIFGQYFNQSLEPIGSNFRVHNENSGFAQSTPAVAATSDGGFVVAWEDYREGKPSIYYRAFNASRNAKGAEVRAESSLNQNQYFPAIAADGVGYFTIAWLQDDNGDFNIYSRKFDNSGQAQRIGFKVNTDNQYLQWAPAVASATSGETLIVWEDKRNGNSDIFCQRMKADGTKQAGNSMVTDAADGSSQWRPFVACQSGRFAVCWEDYRRYPNAVYAQWFDSDMLTTGSNIQVDDGNSSGLKEYPSAAINNNTLSLFSWQDSRPGHWELFARWCNAEQTPENVFSPSPEPLAGDHIQPHVLMDHDISTFVWLNATAEHEKQHVFAVQYRSVFVPVELAFFRSTIIANDAHLQWATYSESNNLGFEIQRKIGDEEYQTIGFQAGRGTTADEIQYDYVDHGLTMGAYSYRLKQIDFDGEFSFSNSTHVVVYGPTEYILSQNYPNPFNGCTCIRFDLSAEADVDLAISNAAGRIIRSLAIGHFPAGSHAIHWDGEDDARRSVPSGVYFYTIRIGEWQQTFKMIKIQ